MIAVTDNLPSSEAPVLAAIDFSEVSMAALVWAARQAQLEEAPLLVLHVVHDPAESPGFYGKPQDDSLTPMLDVAEQMMQEFLSRATADHPELSALVSARTRLVSGLPAGRVVEIAEETGARIVAMGNVGRSALQSMLLGSVTDRVVRTCSVPVVVVKQPAGEITE